MAVRSAVLQILLPDDGDGPADVGTGLQQGVVGRDEDPLLLDGREQWEKKLAPRPWAEALGEAQRRALAAAPKATYTAPSAQAALAELDAFEQGDWGRRFPTVVASWRRAWDKVIPFFAFPPAVRKVVYTTNAIESINARLRKIIKNRGHFPSDEAASKLIWLALRNITADWGNAAQDWKTAMNQFAILYEDRFTRGAHGAA